MYTQAVYDSKSDSNSYWPKKHDHINISLAVVAKYLLLLFGDGIYLGYTSSLCISRCWALVQYLRNKEYNILLFIILKGELGYKMCCRKIESISKIFVNARVYAFSGLTVVSLNTNDGFTTKVWRPIWLPCLHHRRTLKPFM